MNGNCMKQLARTTPVANDEDSTQQTVHTELQQINRVLAMLLIDYPVSSPTYQSFAHQNMFDL